ncbi:MAG: DUF2993 domain-containing protein [Microbacteriaceae bacterium]|nr:MAG: DUF2993 domain-containing protein [Microbacteriaceae bacterium]
MGDSVSTEEFPPLPQAAPRRPRWLVLAAAIFAGLVVLAAFFFVADAIIRSTAETGVAEQINSELPSDVAVKDLTVQIGGFSIIGQYLAGSFDEVTLTAKQVSIGGVPVQARIVAHGIPTDLTKPTRSITSTLTISEAAANKLITIPGATSQLVFGNGTIGYSGSAKVFGFPISFDATATPEADGLDILLTPKTVNITGGPARLDLGAVVTQLIGNKPFPVCVAQYLPKGATVTDVVVSAKTAVLTVSATNIVLDKNTFDTRAHCS